MKAWYALVAFACGFAVAQLWKFVTGVVSSRKQEKRDFKEMVGYLMRSGGMPSGHAASVTALTVYLGCFSGFDSPIFMLAVAFWGIVLYDAIHVRYAVGEQGKALNRLLKEAGKPELPVVEGHTMAQVVVGTILGIIIGLLVFWLAGGRF
jgi:hypothetical protein